MPRHKSHSNITENETTDKLDYFGQLNKEQEHSALDIIATPISIGGVAPQNQNKDWTLPQGWTPT